MFRAAFAVRGRKRPLVGLTSTVVVTESVQYIQPPTGPLIVRRPRRCESSPARLTHASREQLIVTVKRAAPLRTITFARGAIFRLSLSGGGGGGTRSSSKMS